MGRYGIIVSTMPSAGQFSQREAGVRVCARHAPIHVYRVNHFCRPVASSEYVTESFQLLIVGNKCDVPSVSLIHFILLGRSIHQLLRHDDAPLAYPALKRSELTPL